MRIFKVPVYILAVLVTGGVLSCEAKAANFQLSKELEVSNGALLNQAATFSPAPKGHTYSATKLAQATLFSDIQQNWAESFIAALAGRGIIQGFPDGTFRPDEPVTRAQFAAMISKAFEKKPIRPAIAFVDVPAYYWGNEAITTAYQTGFLAGYPGNVFNPEQNIPRVQALVSLANGIGLSAKAEPIGLLNASFQDAVQIPEYARTPVAAATENQLVVNYPDVALLNPERVATRAEVAAFIYQALARNGTVPQLTATDTATQYIVGYQPPASQPTASESKPEQLVALRQKFLLPSPPVAVPGLGAASASPGSSSGSPTAFGADWGDAFTGASFQGRARFTDKSDGAASAGFGLGDARKAVGLELAFATVDLWGDGAFGDGTISFKVHRLLSNDLAVAAGVENVIRYGDTDGGSSTYGVVSKIFRLQDSSAKPFSTLTVSVGLGGGRFRSEDDIDDGEGSVNVFGSLGLRVAEPVALIADWTGQDLTLAASIVPFRNIPITITPGVADITGNSGDGARFILGIGYGFPVRF